MSNRLGMNRLGFMALSDWQNEQGRRQVEDRKVHELYFARTGKVYSLSYAIEAADKGKREFPYHTYNLGDPMSPKNLRALGVTSHKCLYG